MVPDLSVENSFELITSELGKLQKTIQVISKIDEKNMPDIIGLYYQTIMVQTLAKKLKNDFGLSAKSEHKKLFDNVSISYHPEQADLEHLVEVFTEIRRDLKTHCNVMMHPKKELFDKGVELAKRVIKLSDITLALQPLIKDFETDLYEYTSEQTEIIDNQVKLFCNKIRYSKEWPIYRGPMVAVNSDGEIETPIPTHVLISKGLNNWEGWKCYAGIEQIIVDLDGSVWRGWCKVGKQLGWVQKGRRLVFPKDPVICDKDFCHCNFDIMCTKEKNVKN